MAETLQLTHTLGRTGWQVAHAGGATEFALAAVGQCFAHRRSLFNLPLLWKLRTLWTQGMAAIDPQALRLALCVDDRVRVSGARLDVLLRPPPSSSATGPSRRGAGGAARAGSVRATLALPALRGAEARLPPPEAGLAWRVHTLSADGARAFRSLAKAFVTLPKGSEVVLRASARSSRSPAALRAGFPLRVDLLIDSTAGYLTLVPLRRLVIDRSAEPADDAPDADAEAA